LTNNFLTLGFRFLLFYNSKIISLLERARY